MRKSCVIVTAVLFLFGFISCNNHVADIPFPINVVNPQPLKQALQLSAPRKFYWDTVKSNGIKPVVQKLDIDALPSVPYDTFGFKPFAAEPEATHFNFNALHDTVLNLDKVPEYPLHFKTAYINPPVAVKGTFLTPKIGSTLSVSDIGKAQGLNTKTIFSILIDSKGFVWASSDKGLYRYDGEHMQRFTKRGLAGLTEDNNGRIWGINSGFLACLDPVTGLLNTSTEITSAQPKVASLIKDNKGRLWITRTDNGGVSIVDPQSQTYKRFDKSNGLSATEGWYLFQDNKKNIWISTIGGGVDIFNTETGKIKYLRKSDGIINDTAMAGTYDNTGKIWIAFYGGGIVSLDMEAGIMKHYNKQQGFSCNETYQLFFDDKKQLWVATDHGLQIADFDKKSINTIGEGEGIGSDYILRILQDSKKRIWVAGFQTGLSMIEQNGALVYPIGIKTVSTLMEDAEGRIWVGTTADGIEIIDGKKHVMRHLGKDEGLSNNLIQDFLLLNGNIWVSTNGGVDIIDPIHNTLEHIGKNEGLGHETIYEIVKDKKNNVLLTGPSEGVDRIDSAKNTLLHASVKQGLSDSNAVDVRQDKDGKIWVATFSKGVDIIDPEKGTIQSIANTSILKDTSSKLLMPDAYDRMWIGTDKGIFIADTRQGTVVRLSTEEGLCANYITSLIAYNGNVYAGTNNKVSIITPATPSDSVWKIALLKGSEGLVNTSGDWNSNIITKQGQYLWGDNGITTINAMQPEQDTETTYITNLSIMSQPQYFTAKLSLNEHDTVWSNDSFFVKGQRPVNTGYVMPGSINWDSVSGPYNMPENLEIPYDQNYIQFQFTQQHMGRFDTTSYCYILEGIDKHWSIPNPNAITENYLNLSPGKYIFKVCSKKISGYWTAPAVFSFTITPPWWKRWWAYLIYGIIILLIIRRIVYYRSEQLLRENRVLEEKVEHRTVQLKKSIEDLKATQTQLIQSEKMASLGELAAGIAHEIQNPLNFVNNFSEVNTELTDELKEEINKANLSPEEKINIGQLADDIKQNQEKINFHGKRADSIVKGMLQHSRSSTGTKEPTDINVLADEYLRLAYHGLRAKDKTFNATMESNFDESIGKINIVPQDIGRVILNLITNAFYSVTEKKRQQPQGFEPTVSVSTKKLNGKVEVTVKDNGNGIPQKVLDKIYQPFFTTKPTGQGTGLGLSMSYDIITKGHGGDLRVETIEGEGAQFIISLPI